MEWKFEKRKIEDIKPWSKNPRVLSESGLAQLNTSITKFGLPEPIVINADGTIIGGHARYQTLKDKQEEVFCAVCDRQLDEQELAELNIRLNKNIAGEFDFEILANEFKFENLVDWGFDEKELNNELAKVVNSVDLEDDGDKVRTAFNDYRDELDHKQLLDTFDKIYVQFSCGKDSIAQLLHLLEIGIPKEKLIITCCMSSMDPPHFNEYIEYLNEALAIDIIKLYPEGSEEAMYNKFNELLVRYGYPGRMNNWCNTMFKIKPFKPFEKDLIKNNGIVCMGTRGEESVSRSKMNSRGFWGKMTFLYPIFNYTNEDVRDIINKYKIKLHYLYETETRLSCMCCYQQTKKTWTRIRKHYPKDWQKALTYFSLSMKNKPFITGESGYQHDLFNNIIADPDKYYETPVGFVGCDYWRPNEAG